jgi:hypothetical protein
VYVTSTRKAVDSSAGQRDIRKRSIDCLTGVTLLWLLPHNGIFTEHSQNQNNLSVIKHRISNTAPFRHTRRGGGCHKLVPRRMRKRIGTHRSASICQIKSELSAFIQLRTSHLPLWLRILPPDSLLHPPSTP